MENLIKSNLNDLDNPDFDPNRPISATVLETT